MLPTFKIILFARQVSGGKFPIMLRVTYARKSRHFSLNRYVLPEFWDKDACRFKRGYPDYKEENDVLRTYEQRAADMIRDCERDKEAFTFDKFEAAIFANRRVSSVVAWEYLEAVRSSLVDENKHGNSVFYHNVANVVRAFAPKATLYDISSEWLHRFERWQRTKRDCTDGGISVNMRVLRAACNRAIREKLVAREWYPFQEYTLAHLQKNKTKRAITLEEIRKFETAVIPKPGERFAVDLFLFSFYTRGMNLADIAELRRENIRELRIVYVRKKTGREYSVKLTAAAGAILDRYAGRDSHLFPIYADGEHETEQQRYDRKKKVEKAVNRALRTVAVRLGIPSAGLTFYVARHTYATSLKRKGVSVEVISEALGHSDIRTTDTYLKSFGDDVLDAADELLL